MFRLAKDKRGLSSKKNIFTKKFAIGQKNKDLVSFQDFNDFLYKVSNYLITD